MSIHGLLNVGATGLHAHGYGMAVTSQNAQNATTEGYTRRDVRLSPLAPPPPGGGGVRVEGSRRVMDELLERRLLGATSNRHGAETRQLALGVLDQVLQEADGTLGPALDDFQVALGELVGRPSDTAVRTEVLGAAERLATAFDHASEQLQRTQNEMDERIESEVEGINQRIGAIRDLGVAIQKAEVGGQEASDLRDQRDRVVRELSEKLPITTVDSDDGGLHVLLGGSLSLVTADGQAAELSAQVDATTGHMTLTRLTAGQAVDVTDLADSGEIGGLVEARDGALEESRVALDQLAFDIASAYNAVHTAGFGQDGGTGRNLFTSLATADGAARAFGVSADVDGQPDLLAAATDPALVGGDNRNALALDDVANLDVALGGTATVQEGLATMIGGAGEAIRSARIDAQVADEAAAQLEALRESVSGVSVDEEMMNLSKFQRGYQASLRVISVADEMLAQLVNLGRG